MKLPSIALLITLSSIFGFLSLGVYYGYQIPLSEANTVYNTMTSARATISWFVIFMNNLTLTVISFVPFFGQAWMLYAQYNTGYIIGGLAKNMGSPLYYLGVMVNSSGLLEYSAYILAFYESVNLTISLFSRNLMVIKGELVRFIKIVGVVVVILFVSSILEMLRINGVIGW